MIRNLRLLICQISWIFTFKRILAKLGFMRNPIENHWNQFILRLLWNLKITQSSSIRMDIQILLEDLIIVIAVPILILLLKLLSLVFLFLLILLDQLLNRPILLILLIILITIFSKAKILKSSIKGWFNRPKFTINLSKLIKSDISLFLSIFL